MKLTARQIVTEWATQGTNLSGIERALELPFGSLMVLVKGEGPASPELEVLLNMVYVFPSLIDVADINFNKEYMVDKSVYESAIKQLTVTLDDFIGQCLTDDGTITAPTRKDVARARGCLPVWCKNTLIKKQTKR